jgi:regulator of nonsense transcripts 1
MSPQRFMDQNFIDDDLPRMQVKKIHEKDLSSDHVDGLIASSPYPDAPSIGISPAYYPSGHLALLAIATPTKVLVYGVNDKRSDAGDPPSPISDSRKLLEKVLCHPNGKVFAFDFAELVLSLYTDLNVHVLNGIDIQSACSVKDRHPVTSIEFAVGDSVPIYKENIASAFQSMEFDLKRVPDVAMRAWVSQYMPQLSGMEDRFEQAPKINTTAFTDHALSFLAKLTRDSQRLDHMKPVESKHSITARASNQKGQILVTQHRFQNRVMPGSNQVRVEVGDGSGGGYVLSGQAREVMGKSATVFAPGIIEGKMIASITTIGREGPTRAEAQRRSTILTILQGSSELLTDNPWLQNIWFSSGSLLTWPSEWSTPPASSPVSFEFNLDRHINDSQRRAIEHMLSQSDDSRITLIQGCSPNV